MSLGAESWIVLVAIGLYVYDAAVLLRPDELVLVRSGDGSWRPHFGASGWTLRGLEPWLPNLLTPWRTAVRVHWVFEEGMPDPSPTAQPVVASAWTGTGVAALALLVFGALPAGLFLYRTVDVLLAIVGLIYATGVATMALLYVQRERLGLDRRRFWKLAAEGIACPPFAINAVRKAGLGMPSPLPLAAVVPWIDDAEALQAMKRGMAARVRQQMDAEPEGSVRIARLAAVAAALEGPQDDLPGGDGATSSGPPTVAQESS